MDFRTVVNIPRASFEIAPCEQMLFVGSCFADKMGHRFRQERFRATVNPFGVMYNPASVLHTIERSDMAPRTAVITLGTNHVYVLRSTGEIVDNCQKRPQSLFDEQELTVEQCAGYLQRCIDVLRACREDVRVILTVSPIRYAKYGFHGSQLSKATLLLAVKEVISREKPSVTYFPAYEIVMDELRDYRFYAADMLHPNDQAVEYIWLRFKETYFSRDAHLFLDEWKPIKEALAHRPFNPHSEEYIAFMKKAKERADALLQKYEGFEIPEQFAAIL